VLQGYRCCKHIGIAREKGNNRDRLRGAVASAVPRCNERGSRQPAAWKRGSLFPASEHSPVSTVARMRPGPQRRLSLEARIVGISLGRAEPRANFEHLQPFPHFCAHDRWQLHQLSHNNSRPPHLSPQSTGTLMTSSPDRVYYVATVASCRSRRPDSHCTVMTVDIDIGRDGGRGSIERIFTSFFENQWVSADFDAAHATTALATGVDRADPLKPSFTQERPRAHAPAAGPRCMP